MRMSKPSLHAVEVMGRRAQPDFNGQLVKVGNIGYFTEKQVEILERHKWGKRVSRDRKKQDS